MNLTLGIDKNNGFAINRKFVAIEQAMKHIMNGVNSRVKQVKFIVFIVFRQSVIQNGLDLFIEIGHLSESNSLILISQLD